MGRGAGPRRVYVLATEGTERTEGSIARALWACGVFNALFFSVFSVNSVAFFSSATEGTENTEGPIFYGPVARLA